jgi:hypothetical protein
LGFLVNVQEDCVRVLACLGADQNQIMRLAKVKPILKAFGKVMDDGTDKAIDTALWLSWRMTSDDDFCQRLSKSSDVVRMQASPSSSCHYGFMRSLLIVLWHCADEGAHTCSDV